jgi:hypothetical protein
MLVYPRGGCESTSCRLFAHLLACVSQAGLELVLAVQESSWFLSATWCGESLCGLGVWVSGLCFFLVVFLCQVWLQHLSKIFDLWSSCYLLPPSSLHLGSSLPCLAFYPPFSFFVGLGFEFRASQLQGRHATAWAVELWLFWRWAFCELFS